MHHSVLRNVLLLGSSVLFLTACSVFSVTPASCGAAMKLSSDAPVAVAQSISPDALVQWEHVGQRYVLLNTKHPQVIPQLLLDDMAYVYYSATPSHASARAMAASLLKQGHKRVYWLTGTPIDWQRAGLKFFDEAISLYPKPSQISSRELADALSLDGDDIQIIDMHYHAPGEFPLFANALSLLPQELETPPATLSKRQWLVLMDSGNRVAIPVAESLFKRGYQQIAILEGGLPAWEDYQKNAR